MPPIDAPEKSPIAWTDATTKTMARLAMAEGTNVSSKGTTRGSSNQPALATEPKFSDPEPPAM